MVLLARSVGPYCVVILFMFLREFFLHDLLQDETSNFQKVGCLRTQDDKLTQMCMVLAPFAATIW